MEGDDADAHGLVWNSRSRELINLQNITPHSWLAAIRDDIVLHDTGLAPLANTARDVRPYPKACAVIMIKDERDVIGINLDWLYTIGFRKFIIADNRSSDGSPDILRQFRNRAWCAEVILLDDPVVRYTQSAKMTAMARYAEYFWPDIEWIFPIDADEFLIAADGLVILDTVPPEIDAIVIPKVNHCLAKGRTDSSSGSCLEDMPLRSELGYAPPKVACRAHRNVVLSQGNHFIQFDLNASNAAPNKQSPQYVGALSLGFHMREYQVRSFDHFHMKTINGGIAIAAAERHLGSNVGGLHWKRFYNELRKGGVEALRNIFEQRIRVNPESPRIVDDPFLGIVSSKVSESLPPRRPGLANVAFRKPANQSSISPWSFGSTTEEDASGAVSGDIGAHYAFHTNEEHEPWWQVDLGTDFAIQQIWIFNRLDTPYNAGRFRQFAIEVSLLGDAWAPIYTTLQEIDVGGSNEHPFVFTPSRRIVCRFLRVRLLGFSYLHLNQVEIYGVDCDS